MEIGILGYLLLLLLAYATSASRRNVRARTVAGAAAFQIGFAVLVLEVPWGQAALGGVADAVGQVLAFGNEGIHFVFGALSDPDKGSGTVFAFRVLPIIVFFSSLISVLYFLRAMPWIVRVVGGALHKTLGTGRAESMSATANIFVGLTEAPLAIRPYLQRMTRSELFAVMVGGLASIAGSVLGGYAAMGVDLDYLIAACFMAAPAGLLFAKLQIPETETPDAGALASAPENERPANVLDAAAQGAADGLRLALNVGAMLLAFIGLIALVNGVLGWIGTPFGAGWLSLEQILGWLFSPVAWLLGLPWETAPKGGALIGQKLVLNEFVAFGRLTGMDGVFSEESRGILVFALCGFANFASIAILLGGLGGLVPDRRPEIARLGLRAVYAATLANLSSAAVAGALL